MIWDQKYANLEFNCACGTPVRRLHRRFIDIEYSISGNYAYECPKCKTVYDVWSKSNQRRFQAIIISMVIIFLAISLI